MIAQRASASRVDLVAGCRASLLLAFLALLVPRLEAAPFDVNNTADSGSNSLRDAISSATVGANTVAWAAGSGGQIDLLTEVAIADQTTLDVSAAPSSVTTTSPC